MALTGFGLVLALLTGAAGGAQGAEWQMRASITERYNYESNARLSTTSEQEVWGFSTLPTVILEGHSPQVDLSLTAALDYTSYEGADDLDSFDQRGSADLGYNWQRARLKLLGSILHATTRTTELEDTGQDFSDAERLIYSGNGAWSYLVSRRDRFGIRANGSRSVADTSAVQDYSSYGGGMVWSRQVTEKDSFSLDAAYSRFIRTSGLGLESDTASGRLSYSREFSPRFKAAVHGGGRYVMTDAKEFDGFNVVSRNESSTGFLAGVAITYLTARGDLAGSYERSIDESGVGHLQERDTVKLSTKYKATPNISLDLTGTFIMQQTVDDSIDDGRTFASAESSISWQFFRNLYLRTSYRFKTQTFDNADGWAVSHGAHTSLAWRMGAWDRKAGK